VLTVVIRAARLLYDVYRKYGRLFTRATLC